MAERADCGLRSQARGPPLSKYLTSTGLLAQPGARCWGHSLEQHRLELRVPTHLRKSCAITVLVRRHCLLTWVEELLDVGEVLPDWHWLFCGAWHLQSRVAAPVQASIGSLYLLPESSASPPLRFTVRTCVFWPSFSWTTKHCTSTWSPLSFIS